MSVKSTVLPEVKSKWFPAFKAGLPRCDGKVFAITGTTSGTGFIAARTVAELGGTVVLLNRKSERSERGLALLQETVPDASFVQIECDLQDLASVQRAADEVLEQFERLDCLANNAGQMMGSDVVTKDGLCTEIQTNHMSHFLLTKLLFPLLQATAGAEGEARVVNHTSEARKGAPLEAKFFAQVAGPNLLGGDATSWVGFGGPRFARYHQSKLANIVFTNAMRDRLAAAGSAVKALACHPGLSATNLADGLLEAGKFGQYLVKPFMLAAQSPEDGTMPLLTAMVGPEAANGDLYGPNGLFGFRGPVKKLKPRKEEQDAKSIEMLWSLSEEAVGGPAFLIE